ncbi:MAG TPA: hypothetical protein VFN56_02145 [Candidatus Saccharimonadales bacterium]|nr:hypothetical protein [Candidatus Saccharimonadales bacterium]
MKKFVTSASAVLGTVLVCFSTSMPAFAATAANNSTASAPGTGQALEIAPPLITLTVNPDQTVKAQLQLRDIAKTDLVVTNEVNDFVAAGESGTPKILTGDDSNNPYTLKSWVAPLPSFTLAPQKIESLTVKINVPADASPGGHYGVIRFTGTPPQLNGTGVSLSASLGALVLLTVNGKLTHKLSVDEFSVNNGGSAKTLFQSPPLNFVVRLKNSGNVQEEPAGHIVVTDMFGKPVGSMNINLPPHNILPSSIRKFVNTFDQTAYGTRHLFGHYTAELTVSYGAGTQSVLNAKLGFWIIPYKLIGIIVAVLLVLFFGIRFLLRWYKKRLIANIQKSSQKSSKN